MKNLQILVDLTLTNIKMFVRDKSALFWSLFFPFIVIGIFGVLDFGKMGNNNVGLVYDENSQIYAEQLKEIFEKEDRYKFHTGSIEDELNELENDDRTVVLEFNAKEDQTIVVNAYMGKENEQAGSIVTLIAEKVLADISLQIKHIELPFEVNQQIVNVNNLRNIDYMVPGVIAMSLMQSSMFAVIGTIVVNRERGILRRLFATPLTKSTFLISNIVARMIVSLAQIAILIIFSYIVFQIKIVGNLALVAVFSSIGSVVFLAMGFLISGFAKTSETARAMVMPINMLFMFTGGVYFERSVLPKWLFDITKPLPLTYLSDGLRDIMVKGYGMGDQSVKIAAIALLAWFLVLVVISIRTFKWNGD